MAGRRKTKELYPSPYPASYKPPMGPGWGGPASGTIPTPARRFSWGAVLSTHGAFTPYVVEPMAEGILAWLMEQAERPGSPIAFVAAEHFAPTLDKWARSEARRMRFEMNVAEHGEFETDGKTRPILEQLVQWDKRSANYAERLGLDPPSLAKIRLQLAEAHREEDAAEVMGDLQKKYAKRLRRVGRE